MKYLISLVLVGALFIFFYKYHLDEEKESLELIESMQDTLKTWRDKNNTQHAKIRALQTSSYKSFLSFKSKDSIIQKLQKEVGIYKNKLKNKGSVTIFKSSQNLDLKTKTKSSFDDNNRAIYESDFNLDNWAFGSIISKFDSTDIQLTIHNEYSVIIGEESRGLFKDPLLYVEVHNKNPYSLLEYVRTYEVKAPEEKNFGLGLSLTAGVNEKMNFCVVLGLSLHYSLIKF
jgi:hypothetical protein